MKQKTRDNLIYLGVALTIAGAAVFYMFYTERTTGSIQEIPGSILWGIISTPGIVAVIFDSFWQFRRRLSVWIVAIVGAAINILVVGTAYSLRWEPRVVWWVVITLPWVQVLLFVAGKIVGRNPSGSRAGGNRSPGRG